MTLPDATHGGDVTLLDHSKDYRATKRWSDVALENADLKAIVERARALVTEAHLLFPDLDALLERAVVALLTDHLILAGPPGTGKTTLAKLLAEAFGCSSSIATATADWSSYDVIGGLQPRLVGTGNMASEVLQPWLGLIPQAAVDCADAIARHRDNPALNPNQSHWLIIDEFNRAEIDKAFGPLFTALGGGEARIPLWFGDVPERQEVWLPGRFRIIGTLNSVDTAYVFSFSQGLTRRFTFVYVGVPEREQLDSELSEAANQAVDWYEKTYGTAATAEALEAARQSFLQDEKVKLALAALKTVIEFVRYGDEAANRPGWPLGTAQIVDTLRDVVIRRAAEPDGTDLIPAIDTAMADRIIPIMTSLLRDQVDALSQRLQEPDLANLGRSAKALDQVRRAQYTSFA